MSLFSFEKQDGIFLAATLLLVGVTVTGMAFGRLDFSFYPTLLFAESHPLGVASYLAFAFLSLLPTLNETEETIRWNYLQSKI